MAIGMKGHNITMAAVVVVVVAMVPLPDQTIMDGLWCRGAANIEEEMRMEMVTQQGDFQVHPLQGGPFGSQECIMEIPSV